MHQPSPGGAGGRALLRVTYCVFLVHDKQKEEYDDETRHPSMVVLDAEEGGGQGIANWPLDERGNRCSNPRR